jgi:hypothetical protein
MNRVKKGELYISKDCKHSKNEVACVSKGREFVLQQVTNGLETQNGSICHILQNIEPW